MTFYVKRYIIKLTEKIKLIEIKRGEDMSKKIKVMIIFIIIFIMYHHFSYGAFTPNVYQSEDKKVLAYAELNAATITLASGQRIHATNVKGDTQMKIDVIQAPIEVVLLIDTSGSMNQTRMNAAKESACALVENLFDVAENVKISLIKFASASSTIVTKSSDREEVINAINKLSASGGTYMLDGLELAEGIFGTNDEENSEQSEKFSYLIILTDGATGESSQCYDKLLELESNNIKIYDILVDMGNTSAFSRDGKDAGTIYSNISSEELTEIYDEIYGEICSEVIDNSVGNFEETGKNYFVTGNDMYMFLDQELIQGAKLQLEYKINIKAAFNCFKVEIQSEMDDKLGFEESSKMLTEDKSNADYGWAINESLTYKKGHKKVISICTESDSPYVIKKGKKYEAKLLLTCLLSTKEDTNYASSIVFRLNGEEDRTYGLQSMEVNIVPPFGGNRNQSTIIILIIIVLILCASLLITYLYRIHCKKRIK